MSGPRRSRTIGSDAPTEEAPMTAADTAGPDLANRRRFTVAAFRATRRYPGPAGTVLARSCSPGPTSATGWAPTGPSWPSSTTCSSPPTPSRPDHHRRPTMITINRPAALAQLVEHLDDAARSAGNDLATA